MTTDEVETILKFAFRQREHDGEVVHHLDSRGNVERYCRRADEIAALVGRGDLLDWGCLYGHMTFLLERRGVSVMPFDVSTSRRSRTLCDLVGRTPVYTQDLVTLPFETETFDAVLSMGTLEHVADPEASLTEIRRILRPRGYFLIYNLPNRLSWIEWVNRMRGRSDHDRRYLLPLARGWLERRGFHVLTARCENLTPCTFRGFPNRLRGAFDATSGLRTGLDSLLSRVPVLSWFGTNLVLICRKA